MRNQKTLLELVFDFVPKLYHEKISICIFSLLRPYRPNKEEEEEEEKPTDVMNLLHVCRNCIEKWQTIGTYCILLPPSQLLSPLIPPIGPDGGTGALRSMETGEAPELASSIFVELLLVATIFVIFKWSRELCSSNPTLRPRVALHWWRLSRSSRRERNMMAFVNVVLTAIFWNENVKLREGVDAPGMGFRWKQKRERVCWLLIERSWCWLLMEGI